MICFKCKRDGEQLKINSLEIDSVSVCKDCYDAWNNWLLEAREIALKMFLEEQLILQPERSKREDPEKGCGALNTTEMP
jgi:hypothetical protein